MKTFTACDFGDLQILFKHQKYEKAFELLMDLHEYSKNVLLQESPYVLYQIGVCHTYLGNLYLAADWLEKAKRTDPLNAEFASYYSYVLGEIEITISELIPYGLDKKAEVEKVYEYLIEKGQVKSSLQFNMIRFYIKVNEVGKAKTMLENFLARNPNDQEALFIFSSLNTYGIKNSKLENKTRVKCV